MNRIRPALFAPRSDQWKEFEVMWQISFCISFVMRKKYFHIWPVAKIWKTSVIWETQPIGLPILGPFGEKSLFYAGIINVGKVILFFWSKWSAMEPISSWLPMPYNHFSLMNQELIWTFEMIKLRPVRQEWWCRKPLWSISLLWSWMIVSQNQIWFSYQGRPSLCWSARQHCPSSGMDDRNDQTNNARLVHRWEEGGNRSIQWPDHHWWFSSAA